MNPENYLIYFKDARFFSQKSVFHDTHTRKKKTAHFCHLVNLLVDECDE